MLELYSKKVNKRNIFGDFKYMDERETKYIRPLYEQTIMMENNYNNFQPMGMMNYMPMNTGIVPMGGNVMVPPPMTLPGTNNMMYNPVSKP